jgi:hypothetical protein
VPGEHDHGVGQQFQGPAGATLGRACASRRHQQGFFLAGKLALRPRTRILAQRPFQIAFHEAPLGPIHGGAAHHYRARNLFIAAAGIGRQQDLGTLEFAGGSFALAQHRGEFTAFGLAQFDPVTYIHRDLLLEDRTNRQMNRKSGAARSLSAQSFTEKQGQYLAFIYTYSHMFRRPPAEADMQRHFQVSPPSVHQMIVTLERNGLILRQPGVARSIQILVAPEDLPILDWLQINQS